MFNTLIHRLLRRHHFWRHASFDEVAELYASRMMTMFALRFVMVFASVYLYKLEYSLVFIALFWAAFYFLKICFIIPSALIAARMGPKHGLFIANIVFAVALTFLYLSADLGVAAVIVWCIFQAFAAELNNLCYNIDFSKVKHTDHAGKEIGFMAIVEKIASGASPLIGGIIAAIFGPSIAMLVFLLAFLLSAIPLFRSAEPTQVHQRITLKGYPWLKHMRSFKASVAQGADVFASTNGWIIFITVAVFIGDGNEIYAKIGALAAYGGVVGLVASYVYGRLIDRNQGGLLIMSTASINSLIHLLRPTISTPLGVLINNTANDVATTGYTMAYTRGYYDLADTPGYRIAYLALIEAFANAGASAAAFSLAMFMLLTGTTGGLGLFFVLIAFVSLIIASPPFPIYRKK